MRLVIDGRRLTPERTGVGRYLETLLEEWAVVGPPWEPVMVALADPTAPARLPRIDGLEYRVVGANWPGLIWERFGLGGLLQRGDFLFAPANFVPTHWRGPTVSVIHDVIQFVQPSSFSWRVRAWYGWRYRLTASRSHRILTPSHATARDVMSRLKVPPQRVVVAHPGIGPEFLPVRRDSVRSRETRRAAGLRDEDRYFLFLGKRTRRRRIDLLIEAYQAARLQRPHLAERLVLGGKPSFAGDALPPTLPEGVLDLGYLPESQLRVWLSGATALIYPSDYEGFGLPVIEAMACGCPVVTCRNSALTEAGGDAAIYLDRLDVESLAQTLLRLAEDTDQRQFHIDRGLRHVAAFSRSRFARIVADELLEVRDAFASRLDRRARRAGSFLWRTFPEVPRHVEPTRDFPDWRTEHVPDHRHVS